MYYIFFCEFTYLYFENALRTDLFQCLVGSVGYEKQNFCYCETAHMMN